MIKKAITLIIGYMTFVSFGLPHKNPPRYGAAIYGYYSTFEDYKSGNLVKMDSGIGISYVLRRFFIDFENNGSKEKIKCVDIWGFMFKNQLFRINHTNLEDDIYSVESAGKVVYYTNGWMKINDLTGKNFCFGTVHTASREIPNYPGGYNYFSESINSQMFPVDTKKEYEGFKEKFGSRYKELFDCIESKNPKLKPIMMGWTIKACIKDFN